MTYKLGSLFDGSGGFPLAGSLCGIEPVWASEVEPYPIAVTRSRFPKMKHLGDISKINGAEVEPVDIITFGSPCQDLSVAGKRAGLKHEANGDEETTRSGLFMEAVRIIKEMRKATNGKYPSFALWENVPGAFSSNKGEDFRIVLQELIQIVEPGTFMPPVPKNGWPYADHYWGDGWSLCYRTFDAQYWGVPQRRRRIHLVLDLRGERARQVSFEREGVRGYFAEGGTPWQATAGDAESGIGTADREENCVTLRGDTPLVVFSRQRSDELTENAVVSTQSARQYKDATDLVVETVIYESHPMDSRIKELEDGISPAVTVKWHKGAADTPLVCEQHLFENHSQDSRYRGPLDVCPGRPAQLGTGGNNQPFVVERGLKARDYKDATDLAVYIDTTHADDVIRVDDKVAPLQARDHKGGKLVAEVVAIDRAFFNQCQNAVAVRYIVRRLTPTECARLQGFPDKWGHPDQKEDFTDEEYLFWLNVRNTHAAINGKAAKEYTKDQMLTWYNKLHTDSAEYKMWGNGIALPPALYLMQGMAEVLNAEEPTAL